MLLARSHGMRGPVARPVSSMLPTPLPRAPGPQRVASSAIKLGHAHRVLPRNVTQVVLRASALWRIWCADNSRTVDCVGPSGNRWACCRNESRRQGSPSSHPVTAPGDPTTCDPNISDHGQHEIAQRVEGGAVNAGAESRARRRHP